MSKISPLVILLVVAAVALDGVVLELWPGGFIVPAFRLVIALALGQIGMLTVWLVLGGWPLLVRLVLVVGVISLWSRPLERFTGDSAADLMAIHLLYAAVIAVSLVPMRMRGNCWLRGETDHPAQNGNRWQFSLWNLLEWTTCVAIVLGAIRLTNLPVVLSFRIMVLCGGFVMVTILSFWSSLRGNRALVWFGVPLLVCPALGIAVGHSADAFPNLAWDHSNHGWRPSGVRQRLGGRFEAWRLSRCRTW